MTDLSWHFAQPAEAHDAYLVSELGNLFLVEDPVKNLGNLSDNNGILDQVNAVGPELTQAFFQLSAKIVEKDADGVSYVVGTNSVGSVHPYAPHFTIPVIVTNSGSGYVGFFDPNEPHTSVEIPTFFLSYAYSNSSNTLRNIGYSENTPIFDSVAISSPDSSRLQSGAVTSTYGGFYVNNIGTYTTGKKFVSKKTQFAIKLRQ